MKRAHRRHHLIIWVVLGPLMIVLLALSVMARPEAPVNETLPGPLIEEAA